MELKDILITPIFFAVIIIVMYRLKGNLTTPTTRRYFIPALLLKFVGALALGFIYQFYYSGGDTFNYFNESKIITSAFSDSLRKGMLLIFSDGTIDPEIFEYSSRLYWFRATSEFIVSKISALIGLITFNTYSSTALLFAVLSFTGQWSMFRVLVEMYPKLHKQFAIGLFFIPSLFFWGSGLMKDTIALGCICWMFSSFYYLAIAKKNMLFSAIILLFTVLLLKEVRVFMLLAFLPPAATWIFLENNKRVKNPLLRIVTVPVFLTIGIGLSYYLLITVTAGDTRYDIDNIGAYVKINAEYLYRHTLNQKGSAYYLGDLDGTLAGSLSLAPKAIWVTLFRPYPWEANNIVMLLTAFESLAMLLLTVYVVIKSGVIRVVKIISTHPLVLFSLVFSLIFAFAVGITSYNFGTLARYKIPVIPFYLTALFIIGNSKPIDEKL